MQASPVRMNEVFMPDGKRSPPARIGNHGTRQGFPANCLNAPLPYVGGTGPRTRLIHRRLPSAGVMLNCASAPPEPVFLQCDFLYRSGSRRRSERSDSDLD